MFCFALGHKMLLFEFVSLEKESDDIQHSSYAKICRKEGADFNVKRSISGIFFVSIQNTLQATPRQGFLILLRQRFVMTILLCSKQYSILGIRIQIYR